MILGPTPLFWVDKSTGGSGGTLLSSIIAAPLLGGTITRLCREFGLTPSSRSRIQLTPSPTEQQDDGILDF
jgi:hypothetical protein